MPSTEVPIEPGEAARLIKAEFGTWDVFGILNGRGGLMFFRVLITVLLIVGGAVADGTKPGTPLSAEWHGTWTGKLAIAGPNDERSEVPVALKIEPIKGTSELTWTITYGEGEKAVIRDYKILPDGENPYRLRFDEKNGVVLEARLANNVIYSQFAVGGGLVTARYELRGDRLQFEVTSSKPAAQKTGEGRVQGHVFEVIQSAELKK